MSVFKVKLADFNTPTDAKAFGSASHQGMQRSVYITGPKKMVRILKHGDQFTDCNYWKRFAYPQLPLNEAFIEVVTDDGTEWDDSVGAVNAFPVVYNIAAANNSTYTTAGNAAAILTDHGSTSLFCQITNKHATVAVKIKLNGSVIMDLPAASTQVFNAADLPISLIQVDNTGGGATVNVQVVASVKSIAKS